MTSHRHAHSRLIGGDFEQWLSEHHKAAALLGIAVVRKVGAPSRYVMCKGRLQLIAEAVGPADYQGVLKGGRALALEAKHTDDETLPRSVIKAHQADDLDAVHALGGLSLLAVRFGRVVFVVPWAEAPWRRRGGGSSLSPADLDPWRVRGACYLSSLVNS